jgi:polysaccharide biosynthesis/export protein
MRKVTTVAAVLWMILFAAGMRAQTGDGAKKGNGPDLPPANTVQGTGVPADYVIGADDVLHISVWKEPDLSETLPVRPDGKISMPLLNDIPAAGLTPLQLKDSITEKLRKYISNPSVTVVVTGMNSRRVFVSGEVVKSGPMPLLPHMTVLQALSEAGFNQFANVKAIYVLRSEDGKQVKIPFDYRKVVKGLNPEKNIELKPGDTIVVP